MLMNILESCKEVFITIAGFGILISLMLCYIHCFIEDNTIFSKALRTASITICVIAVILAIMTLFCPSTWATKNEKDTQQQTCCYESCVEKEAD